MLASQPRAWSSGREAAYYALALAGSGLMVAIGLHYRIDLVKRANWPGVSMGWLATAGFLVALAMMTVAWLGLAQLCRGRTLRGKPLADAACPTAVRILLMGLAANLLAMITPPFLSDDPLAYAGVGRGVGTFHQPLYTPLGDALPAGDPFRESMSQYPRWLSSGSAYNPGFIGVACLVNALGGDDLTLHLRLFQLVGVLALTLAAVITGRAAFFAPPDPADVADAAMSAGQRAVQAIALVIFCPLTVIEATVNAHNDCLLALSVALFAFCIVRQQTAGALVALLGGLMVKTSGILLLGLYLLHRLTGIVTARLGTRIERRGNSRAVMIGIGVTAILTTLAVVWLLGPWLVRHSSHVARVLGSTVDKYPYCTRSVESAPRALLHIVLGMPTAAWCVGLVFRAAAGALLLYMAIESPPGARHLRYAASFIFFFYLYFNAYSQPWYILSLLPLLPFADPRLRPAMLALPIANLASYALYFPLDGISTVPVRAFSEISQVLIVIVPPSILLWRSWRRSNAKPRGAGETHGELPRAVHRGRQPAPTA